MQYLSGGLKVSDGFCDLVHVLAHELMTSHDHAHAVRLIGGGGHAHVVVLAHSERWIISLADNVQLSSGWLSYFGIITPFPSCLI